MKYIVIPPHSDPTLLYEPLPEWQMYDLMQKFVERVINPATVLSSPSYAQMAGDVDRERRNRSLLFLAGRQLLAKADHYHRWLRALGAVMAGLSTPPSAVHIWLDDLELAHGTTESSEDVLRAAEGAAPYMLELECAVEELANAETVRIYVGTDKQLPATVWLVNTLIKHCTVELAGPFISQHAPALQRLAVFKSTRFVLSDEQPRAYLHSMLPGRSERLWWNSREENAWAWGGYIPLQQLLEPELLLRSGLKAAVVTFTVLGQTVLDEFGNAFALADLCHGAERLSQANVRIVAEWIVGAPGVDEAQMTTTIEALNGPVFFEWLAGLRRFHWPLHQSAAKWANRAVTLGKKDIRADLARSLLFDAPGTIASDRLLPIINDLTHTLMQRATLSPGRVAGAYCLKPPELPTGAAGTINLDPDCALVRLQSEDDKKDAWFAVNWRLRNITAIDHRLATRLVSLQHFVPPSAALPNIPDHQRLAIITRLCQQGVLVEAKA